MGALRRVWNNVVMAMVRPYVRRELPGWGRVYRNLVGSYNANARWRGHRIRWARGKLHGYEQRIDLESWSNREFYFLGRYFDVGNQLLLKSMIAPGETVVDVGANEGMIALMAARVVGPKGRVIAYEPNPGPRAIMEAALKRNAIRNVELRPIGLSDAPAELSLTVPTVNSGEGSFGRPQYREGEYEVVTAQVRVGDEDLATETPRLIKIDVEGFELHVVNGLRKTIARCRPIIVIEMVARHLRNAGTSAEEVVAELERAGYHGWRIGSTGRGRALRVTLEPPTITADLWDDFLWVHPEDPLFDGLEKRIADARF